MFFFGFSKFQTSITLVFFCLRFFYIIIDKGKNLNLKNYYVLVNQTSKFVEVIRVFLLQIKSQNTRKETQNNKGYLHTVFVNTCSIQNCRERGCPHMEGLPVV